MLSSYTVTWRGTSSMASPHSRPSPLRTTKSFTRIDHNDPLSSPSPRVKRASTIQNVPLPKLVTSGQQMSSQIVEEPESATDAFENSRAADTPIDPPRTSVDLDDLPIELIGLTDNFIESLSAKNQASPPNIENIARLFQDFYSQAAQHINTHISALMSRHRRESSPAPSAVSRTSAASLLRAKAAAIADRQKASTPKTERPEQQMITAEELAERKKRRKAIEQQRGTLEEAVERRLCEGIYAKIYRHRSTQDEAADDKLRSKTAALAVVGIGLTDLGVQLTESTEPPEAQAQKAEEIRKWLDGARRELVAMNDSRYPLGKLNHLKVAHKSIVDALSHFHPSASADEIMPMLIYTLITLPPQNLNVISDLRFIERFRWEPKLTGEAAYCLTNLEAAISFLETVDLSTLRSDESPSGPLKSSSRPVTPRTDTFPPAYFAASSAATSESDPAAAGLVPKPSPSPAMKLKDQQRNRRFSDLVNTPAQALGAAGDAMRNTADQGLKTISNSLGDSYKFLMGRLRDPGADGEVVVPKTLEDARKLVGTPPLDDDASVTSSQNPEETDANTRRPRARDDKVLNLIGGRKASLVTRDHSADSSRSGGSSTKRLSGLFGDDGSASKEKTSAATGGVTTPGAVNPALIDSMRNLGNSLNPMTKFAGGIGSFRPFSRTPSSQPVTPQPLSAQLPAKVGAEGGDLATVRAFLPPPPSSLSPSI